MMTEEEWKMLEPGWRPKHKEDVVDLLFMVQRGDCSCRKAASILFPEFNRDRIDNISDLV